MDKAQQRGLGAMISNGPLENCAAPRHLNKMESQWGPPPSLTHLGSTYEAELDRARGQAAGQTSRIIAGQQSAPVSLPELHEQAIANLDELEVMVAKLETRLKGALRPQMSEQVGAGGGVTAHPPLIETQYTINRRIAAVRDALASIEGRVAL